MQDSQVTKLIRLSREGDAASREQVFELLQADLRRHAAALLRSGFRRSAVMQTTMLVNSAVERLLERDALEAENRRHLFSLLARAMHDVLVEEARATAAVKRGGGRRPLDVDAVDPAAEKDGSALPTMSELAALRKALNELAEKAPESAEAIRLNYYCGRSLRDIAEITGQSLAQVRGAIDEGRAWLRARLEGSASI
ncbi:MAG: hypothetical protein KF724_07620 [Phycisphaeraceae bacterium]|nr:hypothetical protein [Phycisphaeraceae bacterium]